MKRHYLSFFLIFFLSSRLNAQISFSPQVIIKSSYNDNVCVAGDFNSDSLTDFIIADDFSYTIPKLWIFKQENGQLVLHDTILLPSANMHSLAAGDLNNDGRTDLVVNWGTDIKIFFQDSVNGFLNSNDTARMYSGEGPYGIACGDLNNDGLCDIAVTNWNDKLMNLYMQNQNGGFTLNTYNKPTSSRNHVIIDDINNDGFNDIIVSNGGFGNQFSFFIYLQDSTSNTFNQIIGVNSSLNTGMQNAAYGLAVGDVDNDGRKDVVMTNFQDTYIFHQNGLNLFANASQDTIPSYVNPSAVYIRDLNNDGRNEIIVGNDGYAKVTVYQSDSSNKFTTYTLFTTENNGNMTQDRISVADFNHDNYLDIASVYWGGASIIYNNTFSIAVKDIYSPIETPDVYPNPMVNGKINLHLQDYAGVHWRVMDLLGSALLEGKMNSSIETIQLEGNYRFLIVEFIRQGKPSLYKKVACVY